jgi:Type IV secretory pathway, TrbL components
MNDLSVIDHFLDVFSHYIDSGFGLLHGEVAFLTATLVVIDMTLAGLFWAMGGEDVIGRLIKKTLYVGAFASSSATSTIWQASCSARLPDSGWWRRVPR